jgi:hypothetical protein
MVERRRIIISRWATQAGRSRAPLDPGYVGIDERSLQDLLAFAPSFARHVRFIDADDQPDGNWSDFFLADSAMVLASIAVFDPADRARRFHDACLQVQSEPADALKFERLKTLFNIILALPWEVDGWYTAAQRLPDGAGGHALRALLASAIRDELAPAFAELRGYGIGAGQPGALGQPIPVDCDHFHPIWQTQFLCPHGSIYQGHFRRQKINAALEPLTAVYERLLGAVSDLAERARRDVATDFADGHLKPHIALYIAFIKQFQVAQGRLNELPARVVDFYYRDILRERLRPPVPDQMFLTFTRAPGITPAKVPRGTPFPAGADAAGHPVLFQADQTLDVTRARLVRVRAMRTTRGPLYEGLNHGASTVSTNRLLRVNVANIPLGPDGGTADGKSLMPWAPFSAAAAGLIDTLPQPAPLGFAIASPSLLLTGGQRTIKIGLRAEAQYTQTVLDPLLREIADATGLSSDKALTELMTTAFGFSVTTLAGWHEIASGSVEVLPGEPGGPSISFQIKLPPSTPPLAASTASPAGATPDASSSPALLARLRQDAITLIGSTGTVKVHPLSVLDGLPIEAIVIETDVIDLPGVTVRTRGGPVDATIPFMPFGAPARVGAWFELEHRELFAKPLDQLTMTINWLGLPAHPRGFAGYYEQYVVGLDRKPGPPFIGNDSFRAVPTLTGDAPWSLSAAEPVYLFRTKDVGGVAEISGPLEATTILSFTPEPRTDVSSPAPPGAALRITLTDPPFGFGDELYSPNVLYAVHSAQVPPPPPKSWWRRQFDRLVDFLRKRPTPPPPPDVVALYPNPPLQLEVASLSIGYKSTATLDVRGAQAQHLLHLLPSGELAPVAPGKNGIPLLLPNISEPAQCDLGFTGLGVAQTLTMLVQIAGDAPSDDNDGGVTWRAMGEDGWVDLVRDVDCHDGSNGLRHAGIVSLNLPPMTADATAERLSWIRIVPQGDPDGFPAIAAITPHVLTATRIVGSNTGALLAIPPKTVKAAAAPLAGVATVDQPIASFGGRAGETAATLPIRLGERLRHKERASLAWDHERLVLERFSDIAKVRVLAARNLAGSRKPGELLVVVMPGPDSISATDALKPQSSVDVRGRVQAALQATTSPFVRVHVVDPVYVRIAVQADIVFRDAQDLGPTQLNDDLRAFLSPRSSGLDLPDEAGPDEIRVAVANFIASRNYVAGWTTLDLHFDPSPETLDWCTLTSAASHDIRIAQSGTASNRSNSAVRAAIDDDAIVFETPQPRLPSVPYWPSIPPS